MYYLPTGSAIRDMWLSCAVRWLIALSCVTCAVIDQNEATDTPPYLVYTSGSKIFRINTDGSSQTTVLNSSGSVNKLGIDFDYVNGRLYWVDSTQLRIMSSRLDGSDVHTIISSGFDTLERLAYDWVTEKIYWSDYGAAEIGVVDVNTGTRTVLITTGVQQHSRPKALALDPIRRNMYWVDWLDESGVAVIERASMDGQDRQIIVQNLLSRPYDLSLDLESNKLYFVDGYYDRVESINTDGTDRRLLYAFHNDAVPYSLVFNDGYLYWTERRLRMISRLKVSGEDGEEEIGTLSNFTVMHVRPAGLAVIAEDRQPVVTNPCSTSGCSNICLLSSTDTRQFSCACPDNIQLSSDQLTCKEVAPTTTESTTTLAPSNTAITLPPSPTSVLPMCPCMNGGVCRTLAGSKFSCLCPANYTGDLCQKHINNTGVCDLPINIITPLCNNGATCVNTGVFEYHCMCLAGYEGRYCEKRTNYGVCNMTKLCHNDGVCINSEDGKDYECLCQNGFTGDNCTLGELQDTTQTITPRIFLSVVATFVGVVAVLVLVIICVFAMFKKQKEKNKALESASSRSNSPMIKKRNQFQSEQTPSSTDTTSREYWLASQPSIIHGHTNLYSQEPRRGLTPQNLRKYARPGSFDELSRESKVLTV